MKTVNASIFIAIVLPGLGIAQRGGGGFEFRGAGVAYPPAGQSTPWLASRTLENIGPNPWRGQGLPMIWWPPDYYDNCCQCDLQQVPQQVPLTVPELPQTVAPEPPPKPAMHEYSWPEESPHSATAFSIVLKDGQVRRAAAVWVLNDGLHYAGVRGSPAGTLAFNAIDMQRTSRLNAEAGLTWPLVDR